MVSPTKLGHFRLWDSTGVYYVGEYPEPQRQCRTILAVAISKDFPPAHSAAKEYHANSGCDGLNNERAHLPGDIALASWLSLTG